VIGSFLNLTALCNWLNTQENNVLLLCAGWKDQFNLEDTIFAGAVLHNIRTQFTDFDDAGVAAEDLYLLAKDNLRAYIGKSAHSHRMLALNIEEDINFCLQVDICTAIPVLEGENLVAMTAAD
jgi:2-phosphosulfolactate phosphatase